eukprot:1372772-Heterocapsa_arctica.AAC.1
MVTRVADSWAGVRLAVVVDDIQVLSVGSKLSVMSRGFAILAEGLRKHRMELVGDKLVLMSTDME